MKKLNILVAAAGLLSASSAWAGRPDNGRPDNGRPDNGRPDNGRPDNGRPDNGVGEEQHATAFIWAAPAEWFNWVFSQPWTQANFDSNHATWAVLLCHEPDAIELMYLFKVGMPAGEFVNFQHNCAPAGYPAQNLNVTLRGNLGYAPSLKTGTLLTNETDKQRLSNILQAVTNESRSVDDATAIVHNQLRSAAPFDLVDSPAGTEAFPWYRRTATKIISLKTGCADTLDRWSLRPTYGVATSGVTTSVDPDCGYQTNKSRVFRNMVPGSVIKIQVTGNPSLVFLRVSKGLEAGFRSPTNTTSIASGTVLAYVIPNGSTIYYVTLPEKGLYNITWAARSKAYLPTVASPTLWDGLNIGVTTYSGNVLYNDLDIFNLRESTFYSRSGGMFNMANVAAPFRTCQLVGAWIWTAQQQWVWGHQTYDPATNTYNTCQRPGKIVQFNNVYQQNDSFWDTGAADLFDARSCSARGCAATRPGTANSGASPDFNVASSSNWSIYNNQARSTPSTRILGEFNYGYFPYDASVGWQYDTTGNAVTTFLTDACARQGSNPATASGAYKLFCPGLAANSPNSVQ